MAERSLGRYAATFVRALQVEPSDADVAWVAEHVTRGDTDHARWELRYARRSLGMLTAERDALDDRTASVVAKALSSSFANDMKIAIDKHDVAERQLGARLLAYRSALADRRGGMPTAERLARVLLSFAGTSSTVPEPELLHRAGELLSRYLTDANDRLRDAFGAVSLPDDIAPSQITQPTAATR